MHKCCMDVMDKRGVCSVEGVKHKLLTWFRGVERMQKVVMVMHALDCRKKRLGSVNVI